MLWDDSWLNRSPLYLLAWEDKSKTKVKEGWRRWCIRTSLIQDSFECNATKNILTTKTCMIIRRREGLMLDLSCTFKKCQGSCVVISVVQTYRVVLSFRAQVLLIIHTVLSSFWSAYVKDYSFHANLPRYGVKIGKILQQRYHIPPTSVLLYILFGNRRGPSL